MNNPSLDAWADAARGANIFDICSRRYPALKLRKSSEGYVGGCPRCGDDGKRDADRFSINTRDQVWNCRGCNKGGDAIALVMNAEDMTFIEAVTEITGEPPPDRKEGPAKEITEDPVARERREEKRQDVAIRETEDQRRRRQLMDDVARLWTDARLFPGSPAERYLKGRAVHLTPAQSCDLRFVAALDYRGFADADAEQEQHFGQFPAMLAAIRNVDGDLVGVHRTYLDRETFRKLVPPGDAKRNAAKKVFGVQKGGHIRLGPVMPCTAIGEGIESTAGWYGLGIGPEDVGLMAGINIGNIAGAAMGTMPHPTLAKRTIPNGIPDMDKPGIVLPPEVRSVILLGDGDSDPVWTRMMILTGARRFRAESRDVMVCWPDAREDFNDIARRMAA